MNENMTTSKQIALKEVETLINGTIVEDYDTISLYCEYLKRVFLSSSTNN